MEKLWSTVFINDRVPKTAENIPGMFSMKAKRKEKPKKKVNTFTPQQIRRPSGNGNNPKPRKEYKRDTTTLVPTRSSPGDYPWTNKDKPCKKGKTSLPLS